MKYYTTKIYQLFLAVAKETLIHTYDLASDVQWLKDRYNQLKEIYSNVKWTAHGQQEHERMLSIEDSGNFDILVSSLENAVEFVKAIPKGFITEKYYSSIKEIANQYLKCVMKIYERLLIYNMHWSDEYKKRNNEAMTFINSYLPENQRDTIVEINNDDSKMSSTETDLAHDLMIIFVFVIFIISLKIKVIIEY